MSFEPAVKWSGSKRSQSEQIVARMPSRIETYREPFCGGCSVLRRLVSTHEVSCRRYVCSDLNGDLIALWQQIKDDPRMLQLTYSGMWAELNKDADFERKKAFFVAIRERFNLSRSPSDFLFLMRTVMNGMPRYNSSGKFNSSFHVSRNGIEPPRLKRILDEWHDILSANDVQFVHQSYSAIEMESGDFVYMDPPYAGTKGMYFGGFDTGAFFAWLAKVPQDVKWMLSYDGKAGDEDKTYNVPKELYVAHEYLESGNSSFRRVKGIDSSCHVQESLYANFPFSTRIARENHRQMELF